MPNLPRLEIETPERELTKALPRTAAIRLAQLRTA